MKKLIYILIIILFSNVSAQVAIGKNNVFGAGLLDFDDNNKGIVLPKTSSINATTTTSGTLYFNGNNGQIEYINNFNVSVVLTSANNSIAPLDASLDENTAGGVVISDGSINSGNPGILVLDSNSKALILPKVLDVTDNSNPQNRIINPHPGMMVYDQTSKSIAVYNGAVWSFLK